MEVRHDGKFLPSVPQKMKAPWRSSFPTIIDTVEHSAHTAGEHPPIISHHLSDHYHISIHPKARQVRQAKIPIKTSACRKVALVAFRVLGRRMAKGRAHDLADGVVVTQFACVRQTVYFHIQALTIAPTPRSTPLYSIAEK